MCCHFMRLLEQEGYNCCSNTDTKVCDKGTDRASYLADLILKSENYILWISSQYNSDTDWSVFCEELSRDTSLRRHGYFLPHIFRLYECEVPAKFRKYEIYELLPDFPSKLPQIIEYLKRVPKKGFLKQYFTFIFY